MAWSPSIKSLCWKAHESNASKLNVERIWIGNKRLTNEPIMNKTMSSNSETSMKIRSWKTMDESIISLALVETFCLPFPYYFNWNNAIVKLWWNYFVLQNAELQTQNAEVQFPKGQFGGQIPFSEIISPKTKWFILFQYEIGSMKSSFMRFPLEIPPTQERHSTVPAGSLQIAGRQKYFFQFIAVIVWQALSPVGSAAASPCYCETTNNL